MAKPWRSGAAFLLLLGYFVHFGILLGAQGVLWADVKQTLHLREGPFGTALLTAPLVAVGFLLSAGHLSAWAGKKRLALAAFAAWGLANLALAAAGNVWALVGALALAGVGMALLETAANGATLDWEQAAGRHVMNGMHAGYSGGAVAGALAAGALREAGWSHELVFASLTVLCGFAALATLPIRFPPAVSAAEAPGPGATLRLLLGPSVLTLLAVLCLLGIFGETVPNSWAVIYLKEDQGASDSLAGAGFALFNLTMLLGRLANATLVARLGVRASLLLSGAGLAVSAGLLLLPGGVPTAVTAFAVMGLATAGVVPTVLSAAARRVPGESGAITGAILAVTYASFILSPPLVGWLAELFQLRYAMLSVGVCGLAMLVLAGGRALRE